MGKRRREIIIEGDKKKVIGEIEAVCIANECLWIKSKNKNKKIDNDGFITITNKGLIDNIFLNKNGNITVSSSVSLKQVTQLLKKIDKQVKYFKNLDKKRKKNKLPSLNKCFYVHLNPELSFLVYY